MIDWSDLQYLLALAERGSLPAAAEALDVNRTTVSRRIAALEKRLQTRLVERSGRELALTPAGLDVLDAARGIEGEVAGLERRLFGRDQQLAGLIRLTTMSGLAQLVSPHLVSFSLAHPDVVLEVNVTNALEDLTHLEADVALRITASPPEDLIARRLGPIRVAYYASHATARSIEEGRRDLPNYVLAMPGVIPVFPPPPSDFADAVVLRSNSVDVVARATADGSGIACLPCYVAEPDERFVRIAPPIPGDGPGIWLLWPPRLRGLPRIRSFVDALTDAFEGLQGVLSPEEP